VVCGPDGVAIFDALGRCVAHRKTRMARRFGRGISGRLLLDSRY
jgi:hypothetical protein